MIGDVRIETRLNRIHASDGVIQIEPKIMQVLVCLARTPGEVPRIPGPFSAAPS